LQSLSAGLAPLREMFIPTDLGLCSGTATLAPLLKSSGTNSTIRREGLGNFGGSRRKVAVTCAAADDGPVSTTVWQQCMNPQCASTYDVGEVLFSCPRCGGLLDVQYDWPALHVPRSFSLFADRRSMSPHSLESRANFSGVWRFRELLPIAPVADLVTIGEGRTQWQHADDLGRAIGMRPGRLFLQYEGFNPSGSFKDNGMAAAFTVARRLGRGRVACASTGNTSASLALFASLTQMPSREPMRAIVFLGGGKISLGKLGQALEHGAITLQIEGDFDACMALIHRCAEPLGLYLMNSINPFRLEGQKTIMYRVLEGLGWEVPDWIVVPGGNLGNASAFGKAFRELHDLGLIQRVPRLAVINATGANTLSRLFNDSMIRYADRAWDRTAVEAVFAEIPVEKLVAKTVASAIEIARPVNLPKALRSLDWMNGVVRDVPDEAILDEKALVGRHGFGCEPASGASIAGLKALLEEKVISASDRVVCILTGHSLKDSEATLRYHSDSGPAAASRHYSNVPVKCPAALEGIRRALQSAGA